MPDATCTNPDVCELFCSGHTFLADGTLLVAGGHNEALGGRQRPDPGQYLRRFGLAGDWLDAIRALVSDPDHHGRRTGDCALRKPGAEHHAPIPERYAPGTGTWTPLTSASRKLLLYPRAFVEPKNGKIFVAGSASPSLYLNPFGTGGWSGGPARLVAERTYGAAVMLDNTVIYFGGGGENNCPATSDRHRRNDRPGRATTPAWKAIAPMALGRRGLNATSWRMGRCSSPAAPAVRLHQQGGRVFAAERWNPSGGSNGEGAWTTLANAGVVRVYHSTASLMADGQVLSIGSGDGGGVVPQNSYQIYSPPYLFQGDRPSYGLESNQVHYGATFVVTTADAAMIRKVHLIRLASTTHAFDMGQRLRSLTFQVSSGGLTVTGPASGRLAPPGPYMLFLVNLAGVPSVGQIVRWGHERCRVGGESLLGSSK